MLEPSEETPPFDFVTLEHGKVHYRLQGAPGSPLVVLVHGMGVPLFVWEPLSNVLREHGYRTLRFDLYGRGYSDKPDIPNTPALFETQLFQLLEALELRASFHLIGSSMGGAICVQFSCSYPEKIRSLTLVSPAGAKLAMPWTSKVLQIKLVGELIPRGLARRTYLSKIRENFFYESLTSRFVERLSHQMEHPGFFESLLSTLRHFPLSDMEEAYRALAELSIPTLLLWGTDDKIVPYDNHTAVLATNPGVSFHTIVECGHIPHYEKTEEVSALVLPFLQENSTDRAQG